MVVLHAIPRCATLKSDLKNRELPSATATPELPSRWSLGGLTLAVRGVSVSHSVRRSARTGVGGPRVGPYLVWLQRGVATHQLLRGAEDGVPMVGFGGGGFPGAKTATTAWCADSASCSRFPLALASPTVVSEGCDINCSMALRALVAFAACSKLSTARPVSQITTAVTSSLLSGH
jgi:hypothetical protein